MCPLFACSVGAQFRDGDPRARPASAARQFPSASELERRLYLHVPLSPPTHRNPWSPPAKDAGHSPSATERLGHQAHLSNAGASAEAFRAPLASHHDHGNRLGLVRHLAHKSPRLSFLASSAAREDACAWVYRISMSGLVQPATAIRPPSDPPAASQR